MTCSSAPAPWLRTHTCSPSRCCGHGVLAVFVAHHRRVRRHRPGQPEHDRVRLIGHPMQPDPFFGEHLDRDPAGHPMHPAVHLRHELLTRLLQLSKRGVLGAQVGVGGNQVGLGDLHRRLHPTLGGRVGRLTSQHGHPVMPAERDGLPVPDRHPGHMLDGDGFFVVGQHIRRHPTQHAERAVQRGDHRRLRPVPQRPHHPEPGPGQPGHEQHRLDPVHDGAVAEVVLQPHPRLGHPRPVDPGMSQPVGLLHLRDRAPGRPVRTRQTRAPAASRGPCRRGSCLSTPPPTPRSCPETR